YAESMELTKDDIIMLLSDDQGVGDKGSETTIEDLSKNWQENIWAGATVIVSIEGTLYARRVTSNTSTKLTFKSLPEGVKAKAKDRWALKQGLKTQFTPIEKANQHNVSVTANTNILSSEITPTNTPCLFRIMVCLNTAGVLSAMVTKSNSEQQLKLNAATNLVADSPYMFDRLSSVSRSSSNTPVTWPSSV
ncbi:unnamed protein product, partial [marine sediment metagenome]